MDHGEVVTSIYNMYGILKPWVTSEVQGLSSLTEKVKVMTNDTSS